MNNNQRLLSIDFLRGITVAGMILVNNPGSWDFVYSPLNHSEWNGCTPTDLVFPLFIFIAGLSINISFSRLLEKEISRRDLYFKILKRTFLLFLIGLLIHAFPFTLTDIKEVRIPGVLQRISLVFFFCSIIFINTSRNVQWGITALLLVSYWLLMTIVPVPGIGQANLGKETNLAAWIDRLLLDGHLWAHSKTWDPEGVLSTLPSIATGMLGVLAADFLKQNSTPQIKTYRLLMAGSILVSIGLLWDLVFPMNKSLWTSSFVCFTGGIAMIITALCYWIMDHLGHNEIARPFIFFGYNALIVYIASETMAKLFYLITFAQNSQTETLKFWAFNLVNVPWLGPYNASLLLALIWVLLFWLIAFGMYRKRIFIKV